jgi:hypothetical protein
MLAKPRWPDKAMGSGRYILNAAGQPVPEPDLFKWAHWYEADRKSVGCTKVGGILVSTVFLGLDHRFGPGAPLLWETMTFDQKGESLDCWRCAGNLEQAEAQHEGVVAQLEAKLNAQRTSIG